MERVPDFYDEGFDVNSPSQFYKAKYQRIREKELARHEMRELAKDIGLCYRREGVNHFENCKHLTEVYYLRLHRKDHLPYEGHTFETVTLLKGPLRSPYADNSPLRKRNQKSDN